MFDYSEPTTFYNIKGWKNKVDRVSPNIPFVIVGTKYDIKKGRNFIHSSFDRKTPIINISSLSLYNIYAPFREIAKLLFVKKKETLRREVDEEFPLEPLLRIVDFSDRIEWRKEDKIHREDGPAIEYHNGDRLWLMEDVLHREEGPAIEWNNGNTDYFVYGIQLTKQEFYRLYPLAKKEREKGSQEKYIQHKRNGETCTIYKKIYYDDISVYEPTRTQTNIVIDSFLDELNSIKII